ncbi:transcriptional repressor [Acholeplasma granularum]|uniref:transcriptional repressor n=1 Tax=Acholeplasma granularum TaxID=264635 RepID=UPI0004712A69|nr:transcriptional repressor [Acholeplasma granularum]
MKPQKLIEDNKRFTKARRALLEVLKNRHLTFKEIYEELSKKGYKNMSTLYNNLQFFLNNNLIIEINLDGTKYYDLGTDNPFHDHDSHLHIVLKNHNESSPVIKEVDYPEIYDAIKSHPVFKHYDIDYIRILVSATKNKK